MPAAAVDVRPSSRVGRVYHVAVAGAALVVVDCLIRMLPFGVVANRLQRHLRWQAAESDRAVLALRVAWAVAAAQRRLPWTVPCLAQAVAANRLLAWRGVPSEMWLGVRAASTATVDAHAWLVADGTMVTGGAMQPRYTPLHCLVTSSAASSAHA